MLNHINSWGNLLGFIDDNRLIQPLIHINKVYDLEVCKL